MANTTNFNWETPDDTDLVKDGAAAIRTLGSAIDTSLVDLKGGTTGQILSKATNTDMDFTWITNDVGDITAVSAGTGITGGGTSGAITITNDMATTITASGDIVVGTGSGTYDNLPIGTTGQVLTADTTVSPYKVKWANAASGGGMTLLSTTTLSGASTSITIDPTGYVNLCIVGENVRFAGNDYGQIELNSSTTNTYVSAKFVGGSGSFQGYASQAIIYFAANTAATGANNNVFSMNIYNVNQTASWKNWDIRSVYKQSSDNTQVVQHMGGAVHTTSTITNFVISPSGNTWTSGTVKVYGVK